MAIQLNLDGTNSDLAPTSDLSKFLQPGAAGQLNVSDKISQIKAMRLGDLNGKQSLPISPSHAFKWNLGANGNVSFGLTPAARVSVDLQNKGALFTYNLGEDESQIASETIRQGLAYVSVTFQFSLDVSSGAQFSTGNLGLSADIDKSALYSVTYRKAFPQSAVVLQAIQDTFHAFVLPFQAESADNMQDGDYLEFSFQGKFSLGLGATYGFSSTVLAGKSTAEVIGAFNQTLGAAILNRKPALTSGASFSFEYEDTEQWRVIVGRTRSQNANLASMWLFREASKSTSESEAVGIRFTGIANGRDTVGSSITGKLVTSAFGHLSNPNVRSRATAFLSKSFEQNPDSVQKYIGEVHEAAHFLLSGAKAQLQLQQEQAKTNTALFHFQFDFSRPEAQGGYQHALRFDCGAAMETPGVTLNPDSFVESAFRNKTSASLQLFDLSSSESTEYFDTAKLLYCGNRIFRLTRTTGVTETNSVNARQNSCEVFFAAEAPPSGVVHTTGDLIITLNFVTKDHNRNAVQQSLRILQDLGDTRLQNVFRRQLPASDDAFAVTYQFSEDSFRNIQADDYEGGKPPAAPHWDIENYAVFVEAIRAVVPADNTRDEFLELFPTYERWGLYNVCNWDEQGSTRKPDRAQTGVGNQWPQNVQQVPDKQGVFCYLNAAQDYMNLCENLKHLSDPGFEATAQDASFTKLMKALKRIISQDIGVFFIKPTVVALFRSSRSHVGRISPQAPDDSTSAISIEAVVPAVMDAARTIVSH